MFKKKLFTYSFFTFLSAVGGIFDSSSANAEILKIRKDKISPTFLAGEDSYRMVFDLGEPRRYATRFIKGTRTLQIRIIPARMEEFNNTSFYDTRFVKRVYMREEKSEVTIHIQLKNLPIGWVVATQNKPWRILIDFWRTEPESKNLEADWNWQPDFIEGLSKENIPEIMTTYNLQNEDLQEKKSTPKVNGQIKNESQKVVTSSGEAHNQNVNSNENKNKPVSLTPDKKIEKVKSDKEYNLPEIYGRLEVLKPISEYRMTLLQAQMGSVFGTKEEFDVGKNFAEELYKSGHEDQALSIYRRLVALSERKFKSDPKILWNAGESAYLTRNFDLANDYFRSLLLNSPGSEYAALAKLRLLDIDELSNSKTKGMGKTGYQNAQKYSEMALYDKNPLIVKVASSLRVLNDVVDENPNAVKTYQQNIDACVTSESIPFDLLKNCAYDQIRSSVEKENINTADAAVQQFKKKVAGDKRSAVLENIVNSRVKDLLKSTAQNKQWEVWTRFEKGARQSLLEFTYSDPESLFTRAEAFDAVGENQKAIQLYSAFWQASTDQKRKNEAAAITARLYYRSNKPTDAEVFLRRIEQDEKRKADGLTDKSVQALKELSVAPYRNKIALRLLLDEMKLGRYVERDLPTLGEWARALRGTPDVEPLYEKILAFPAKSLDEIQTVEASIMQYAEDLRDSGRFAKSGDMFLAMANLAQGTHRAEAAYKAGVVYARAGLFDKAKTAWLLAANDTNDKRYSSLASERLDRLNK
ncbi:tetratricopeptide repeat protein [Fluviispira sanaruensis]|uniref:Tetratrico peptide repeat group 5 domain-containing protein n=1 Tax=Fluviispira sanaruensis TaxID=2493639 RepID=A0A4P2VUD1_FLUSA|nr:tetratricopeptide repeat protein [Fluviispira sanaruensis]BBH52452.1 hypothetical protein JCM31447_08930 [Fluviispira sanaruensis]